MTESRAEYKTGTVSPDEADRWRRTIENLLSVFIYPYTIITREQTEFGWSFTFTFDKEKFERDSRTIRKDDIK